jgi:hypothetical protein
MAQRAYLEERKVLGDPEIRKTFEDIISNGD